MSLYSLVFLPRVLLFCFGVVRLMLFRCQRTLRVMMGMKFLTVMTVLLLMQILLVKAS